MGKKIRPPEAEKITGIPISRLAKFRVYGGGAPYIRVGRSILYDTDDLEAWLNKQKFQSTSEYGYE